jgi:hypothetical protein
MAISENYERTIEAVRVNLCFDDLDCDPDHITSVLQIQPDLVLRAGDTRELRGGKRIRNPTSQWALDSRSISKDVNVQIRDILERLDPVAHRIEPSWNPFFNVIWKGNYLYAGSGPFYERDVLAGIARIGGELFQDIYQIDRDDLREDG